MKLSVNELLELNEIQELFAGCSEDLLEKEVTAYKSQIIDYLQLGKCDSCEGLKNCYMINKGYQVIKFIASGNNHSYEMCIKSRRCQYNPHKIEDESK